MNKTKQSNVTRILLYVFQVIVLLDQRLITRLDRHELSLCRSFHLLLEGWKRLRHRFVIELGFFQYLIVDLVFPVGLPLLPQRALRLWVLPADVKKHSALRH